MTNTNTATLERPITADYVLGLDVADFASALNAVIGDMKGLEPFLEPGVLHSTHQHFITLLANVDRQLAQYSDGPTASPDWVRRTQGFRALILSRVRMIERRVLSGDRRVQRESGDLTGRERESEWKRFAHRLIEAMLEDEVDNDTFNALDDLEAPFGGLTAREWVARRIEKVPSRTGDNA
jgi:hypothetical protein